MNDQTDDTPAPIPLAEPIALLHAVTQEPTAWLCGTCGHLHISLTDASTCHARCPCGAEARAHRGRCDACLTRAVNERGVARERARRERSKVLDPATYTGPVYDPGRERHYKSLQDLRDRNSEEFLPEYVYACEVRSPGLDIEYIISSALEEYPEDARENIGDDDRKALDDFLTKWWADLKIEGWFPIDAVLILNPETTP